MRNANVSQSHEMLGCCCCCAFQRLCFSNDDSRKTFAKKGQLLALVWLFEAWKTFVPHYHNKQNIKGCPAIRELLFFTYYYSTHQRCLWVETRRQPVINNQTSHSTKFLTFEDVQRGLLCVFWLLLNLFLFYFFCFTPSDSNVNTSVWHEGEEQFNRGVPDCARQCDVGRVLYTKV